MRASAVFLASILALGALAPIACTQDFGIFDPQGTGSSTGGTGGTMVTTTSTMSTTSTGMGGTGGAPECVMGDACSDQNQCTIDACDTATGKCTHTSLPDGPDTMGADLPGDCLAPHCFSGMPMQVADDSDVPKDGNPCTEGSCKNGVAMNTNLGTSTSCGQNLYCDGEGNCVGCTMDDQCADPGECQYAKCENKQCVVHDSSAGNSCNEGGVVCNGMGDCVGCINDMGCTGSKICISNNCATSCNTGMKDGKETDIDCGGLCMTKCGLNKGCKLNSDCTTGNCNGTVCIPAGPTCSDGTKNGTETDVDCGGSCATKCANTKMCLVDGDCSSSLCMGNVCVAAAPTCSDGTMNGTETDVDCGGATCVVCGNAKKCSGNGDCLSVSCIGSVCVPTACSNGMKDGSETSVDCGGSCTKCPNAKACLVNADCQSGNCMSNVCAP